eukprot:SAG11_NODE_450_length_9391_cov_16.666272_6_plen_299_part_00
MAPVTICYNSRHSPADFAQERASAPADLEHLLDDVEFIEFRRRDFEVDAMIAELLRRGDCAPPAASPLPGAAVMPAGHEFNSGDHIFITDAFRTSVGLSHHGIYSKEDEDGPQPVVFEWHGDVSSGMQVRKSAFHDWEERSRDTGKPILKRAYPPAVEQLPSCAALQVLARARRAVGHRGWVTATDAKIPYGGYSPWFHCEHFAMWCKTESTGDVVASNENQILKGWLKSAVAALPVVGAGLKRVLEAHGVSMVQREAAMVFMTKHRIAADWLARHAPPGRCDAKAEFFREQVVNTLW